MHVTLIETLALIVLFALSDRFVGGGAPKLDAILPGRSVWWAGMVLTAVGFAFAGVGGAAAGAGWAGQRSIGFGDDETTPTTADDFFRAGIRHAIAAIPLGIGAILAHTPALAFGFAVFVYLLAALGLAGAYGAHKAKAVAEGRGVGNFNTYVELGRGAAYGFAAAVSLGILGPH